MDQNSHFQGGFSKYLLLDHTRNVFLKDNRPPEVSVLLKPFSIGMHFADRADVKIGSTGVIQGAGASAYSVWQQHWKQERIERSS